MSEEPNGLILVADDDEDIVRFVEVNLRLEGFEVATASDGEQALQRAYDMTPDLVLLDVMMPKIDGFEVCQRLRRDSRTKHISVIMLTAKSLSADKVVGLTAGADDYMIKPFDPIELVARVKSALRRSKEMRDVNPLTQLPGNVQVQEEVSERVASGAPFALMYVDLDNFKSFNDFYGFLRGDEAIKLLARCVSSAVESIGGADAFVGHIGGDDLVAIVDPGRWRKTPQARSSPYGTVRWGISTIPRMPSGVTSRSPTAAARSTGSRSRPSRSGSHRTRSVPSTATSRPPRSRPR